MTQHKYSAKKATAHDGTVFPSKKECRRYEDLLLLVKLGEIVDLTLQNKWELVPRQGKERAVNYMSDFQYFDKEGRLHVEDTKGYRTREYIIKRKLMLWIHGVTIEEV